jgi:hypothetical protein
MAIGFSPDPPNIVAPRSYVPSNISSPGPPYMVMPPSIAACILSFPPPPSANMPPAPKRTEIISSPYRRP